MSSLNVHYLYDYSALGVEYKRATQKKEEMVCVLYTYLCAVRCLVGV